MKPMMFVVAIMATICVQGAAAQTIGAWDYETTNDLYAGTTNDSSNTFGQQCAMAERSCSYFVGLPASCKEGASTPAVVNADSGAFQARLICIGRGGRYNLFRYVFEDFDVIDSAVRNSRRISIAVPMGNSEVAVLRFSLDGATAAIALMRGTAGRGFEK